MKVELESPEVLARGVQITSETPEEKAVLQEIWVTAGGAAFSSREKGGNIKLVICPHILRESWPICQARFTHTGNQCNRPAKYRIRAMGSPGVVCGYHARAFTKESRIPLAGRGSSKEVKHGLD
jgi:hypothetical protein